MSTRTQVQVTDGEEKLTLYHHTDGYPSYMLPLIKKAWSMYGKGWEGARVGKVASMLCAVDPIVFEPEDNHKLHADIEYYYIINCKGGLNISTKAIWTVTIYTVNFYFENKTSDKKRLTKLGETKVGKIDDTYIERLEAEGNNDSY